MTPPHEKPGRLRAGLRTLIDHGYLPMLSMNLLLQLLGFGSTILVAGFLLPKELGMLRTAQSYAGVAVILAGVGLTTPIMRYCADQTLDTRTRLGMLGSALRYVAIASCAVVLLVWGTMALLPIFDPALAKVYAIYAMAIPALALTSLLIVHMQATQQFGALAWQQSIVKLASALLIVAAAWAWGLAGALIMTVAVTYAGLLPMLRQAASAWAQRNISGLPRDFFPMAMFSLTGAFISALGQSADFILMGVLGVDGDAVGRYSLASIFLLAATTVTGSIQAVVTPKFTALLAEPERFMAYLHGWVRRMTLIGLAVAAASLALSWLVAAWLFGEKYAGFFPLLAILMLKYVIWSSFAVIGAALLGAGIIKPGIWIAAITTALSFGLGYPLCSLYGATGVAWMQVAVALLSLCLILWVRKVEFQKKFLQRGAEVG